MSKPYTKNVIADNRILHFMWNGSRQVTVVIYDKLQEFDIDSVKLDDGLEAGGYHGNFDFTREQCIELADTLAWLAKNMPEGEDNGNTA